VPMGLLSGAHTLSVRGVAPPLLAYGVCGGGVAQALGGLPATLSATAAAVAAAAAAASSSSAAMAAEEAALPGAFGARSSWPSRKTHLNHMTLTQAVQHARLAGDNALFHILASETMKVGTADWK
jgi:hypothetical protein